MKQILQKLNQSYLFYDFLLILVIFILGLSLANYLGVQIRGEGFILGWLSCLLLLFSLKFMEFYTLTVDQLDQDHQFLLRFFPGLSVSTEKTKTNPAYSGLILILICLGGWAVIQFVLLQTKSLPENALVLMGLMIVAVLLIGLPALRLSNSGYAELLQAFLLFGLMPTYAYQTMTGETHVLMILICLPLTLFYLSSRLVYGLFHYSEDQKSGRINFLQIVGWKQGMTYHNLFILFGFVIYACIPLFHFPTHLFLNPLLTLPLGLILIFMLFRIERGKKPEWQSLMLIEKILLFLIVYFLIAAMVLR